MITCMDNPRSNTNPTVNPSLAKNEGYQARKTDFNCRSVIKSLNLLTNSTCPESEFAVHQCMQFSNDPKLLHDQSVKRVLNYLKGTATQEIIMKLDLERGSSATWTPNSPADGNKKKAGILAQYCL